MSATTTLDEILIPLMDGPTIRSERCVICGARQPLEQHHVVRRSAGQLVRDGKVVLKPTLTLCGIGNVLAIAGRPLCHGLAHHDMLHFRFNEDTSQWEYLVTTNPTKYAEALNMSGWAALPYYKRIKHDQ